MVTQWFRKSFARSSAVVPQTFCGSAKVPQMFRRGSADVPQGLRKGFAGVPQGFRKIPQVFRKNSVKVPQELNSSANTTIPQVFPRRFCNCSTWIPQRFRKDSTNVRQRLCECSTLVPQYDWDMSCAAIPRSSWLGESVLQSCASFTCASFTVCYNLASCNCDYNYFITPRQICVDNGMVRSC